MARRAAAKRLKGDHAARFAPALREVQRVEAKSDARRPRADAAAEGDAPADDAQPANDAPANEPVAKTG